MFKTAIFLETLKCSLEASTHRENISYHWNSSSQNTKEGSHINWKVKKRNDPMHSLSRHHNQPSRLKSWKSFMLTMNELKKPRETWRINLWKKKLPQFVRSCKKNRQFSIALPPMEVPKPAKNRCLEMQIKHKAIGFW